MGQYDKALQVASAYQTRFPGNTDIYHIIARNYYLRGEYDAALSAIDKSLDLSPSNINTIWEKGNILFCRGDLLKAETWSHKLLDSQEPVEKAMGQDWLGRSYFSQGRLAEARKYYLEILSWVTQNQQKDWGPFTFSILAYIDRRSGNFIEAQKKLDQSLANVRETDDWTWIRDIFCDKGVTFTEAGRLGDAEKMAAELKVYIDKGLNKKLQRLHDHLLGLIALKRNDAATAIALIKGPYPFTRR